MESKLYGLVLAGGKSTRMGRDKGEIEYHGIPQKEYLYNILSKLCDKVFLSVREDQLENLDDFKTIVDQNKFRGPLNGMQSAHFEYPKVAWLVVAADLPLITEDALEYLIQQRDLTKIATAMATRETKLPEPLCAIWESSSFHLASEYVEKAGKTCPRKFLINHSVKLVFPEDDSILLNANHPEDLDIVQKFLNKIEQ